MTTTDKHLKGVYGNTDVEISVNSHSPKIASGISNLGSVSSNWNSRTVKEYNKNSSEPN